MNLPLEIQQFPADIFSDYVKLTENFEQVVMKDPDKLDDWAVATDYCIEHGISERPARIAAFRRLMPWRGQQE